MENYFIIHGSFGSPFGNWFSWLQDFIATDGKYLNRSESKNAFDILSKSIPCFYKNYIICLN